MRLERGTLLLATCLAVSLLLVSCSTQAGVPKFSPTAGASGGKDTTASSPATPVPTPSLPATPIPTASVGVTITGYVVDGRPLAKNPLLVIPTQLSRVSGVVVRITNLHLIAVSDETGDFHFSGIDVTPPCIKVDVEASAPGFGTYRSTGLPMYPDGKELMIDMEAKAQSYVFTPAPIETDLYRSCH